MDGDEVLKELQCAADSSKVSLVPPIDGHVSMSRVKEDHPEMIGIRYASLQSLSVPGFHHDEDPSVKEKEKKKHKGKKRKSHDRKDKHTDPEYLEMKRLKKEKETAKLPNDDSKAFSSLDLQSKKEKLKSEAAEAIMQAMEDENRTEETEIQSVSVAGEKKAVIGELHSQKEDHMASYTTKSG